jgi:hypothetical protein
VREGERGREGERREGERGEGERGEGKVREVRGSDLQSQLKNCRN